MKHRRVVVMLLAVSLLLTVVTPLSAAPALLKPYKAVYSVKRGNFVIGTAEISLSIGEDNRYHYLGHTQPVGLVAVFRKDEISEESEGTIREQQVQPASYRYQHKKKGKVRQVDLTFDWKAKRVTNRAASSRWTMPIPENTQDKFSQQLALMLNLLQGQAHSVFQVADGGHLKTYRFNKKKEANLKTQAGEFKAIALHRTKEDRPSRAVFWMAPKLNYVPIKIIKKEDDGEFIMELKQFNWL